jgi:predicted Zn-dependent peptidase
MKQHRSTFAPIVRSLPNGIPVVIDQVMSVDSCAIGIWVKAGTRDEPVGKAGVAHFVEHTSFRRTKDRTTNRIAREFENVGAYANAYTTKEETCFYARTLTEHLPRVADVLADVVLHPIFDPSDVEKERTIITEEIRSYEDEAEEFIFDIGEQHLFGDHPLGPPIVGTVDSVRRITPTDVRGFHTRHYHRGSLILTVSGNVDPDMIMDMGARLFDGVPRAGRATQRTAPTSRSVRPLVVRRPVQQAHVLWQARTPGQRSSMKHALLLLNVILGDGMSSRLNVRIRERKGLAYSVYSQVQLFADCGVFAIYAGLDDRHVDAVHGMLERELADIAANGVTRTELQRAKQQVRASKVMSLESLSARMSMLGKGMIEDGRPEDPFTTIRKVDAVTLDQVKAVAARLLSPERFSRCLILPSDAED